MPVREEVLASKAKQPMLDLFHRRRAETIYHIQQQNINWISLDLARIKLGLVKQID